MANRVFVHIGAPKAGTTYLQTVLWANQRALADAKMLLPGRVKFDHNRVAQANRKDSPNKPAQRVWQRVLREVHAWPGDALISNEWISMANRAQAERMVKRLQPSEVHLVFTARSFVSAAPSAWQEMLKLGFAQPLGEFVRYLDSPADDGRRWSWERLDPALVLDRWVPSVPPENIHLVTVPPRGDDPDLLWKRFANACGFDPDVCDLGKGSPNESLGVEGARLLELVGPRLRDAIDADTGPWREPYRWIQSQVAGKVLVRRGGHKIALDDGDVELLQDRARASVDAVRRAGYDVVGNLDELTQNTMAPDALRPEDVDQDVVIERAGEVMAALLRRAREEKVRADHNAARVRRLESRLRRKGVSPEPSRAEATVARAKKAVRPAVQRLKRRVRPQR